MTVTQLAKLGGDARAAKLNRKQRRRIAKRAARKRWNNKAK